MELIARVVRHVRTVAADICHELTTGDVEGRERARLENVDACARYLVQQIARENAAVHAHAAARAECASPRERVRLARRVVDATRLREFALVTLRDALGLPEDPSQAEIGIWGEAP